MSEPRARMINGLVLTALGASSVAAGAVADSPLAYFLGGIVIVTGVAEVAYGVWSRKR
jgi:uncharacterized membrane protein HdeD (DUF308 family)